MADEFQFIKQMAHLLKESHNKCFEAICSILPPSDLGTVLGPTGRVVLLVKA